ncbi:hypothetical protein FPV67DRAFT_1458555 [Lyophyllum atratum]|nr:hypothetical protein FPV67DRAFT_1458555 [Lyophyllum atratum]
METTSIHTETTDHEGARKEENSFKSFKSSGPLMIAALTSGSASPIIMPRSARKARIGDHDDAVCTVLTAEGAFGVALANRTQVPGKKVNGLARSAQLAIVKCPGITDVKLLNRVPWKEEIVYAEGKK